MKKLTNHQNFCLGIKDKQAVKMSNESSTVQFDIYHFFSIPYFSSIHNVHLEI